MVASWWDRFPGRLEAELEDFRARGLRFELDDDLLREAGRVLLRGTIEHHAGEVRLDVLYPDLFPYLRPEVFAPGLKLSRHQNPVLRNLCLLDRDTSAWQPEGTAAWLVATRVPYLLSLFDQGYEAMAAAEVAQGEPVSAYFETPQGTVVFVPAAMLGLDARLTVGSGRLRFGTEAPPSLQLRGLLVELVVRKKNKKTSVVASADEPLARRFGGVELPIRWARLDTAPDAYTAEAIFAAADRVQPGLSRPPWHRVAGGEVGVTGVVFPEEIRQDVYEDAWLFAARFRRSSARGVHESSYVIRGERLTCEDLGARIPKLAGLREGVVAQLGLGALGGPIALELARNQVGELRLLEHDRVEAAQTVRWPYGLSAVAHAKLRVISEVIASDYPYTKVELFPHRLGETAFERQGRQENEVDLLDRFLSGASVVLDATAELGVQQLVSDAADERDMIQLYVSATEGARGGQIGLIVPASGGCWHCWKLHALHGTIPLPPFDSDGTVQPRGCASPTFTGASFDLIPIVAQATRITAAALGPAHDLTSTAWVCAIPDAMPAAPEWHAHRIAVHHKCPRCTGTT